MSSSPPTPHIRQLNIASLSEQEKVALKHKKQRIMESIDHCQHVLNVLTQKPDFWGHKEYKRIRECISYFKAHPEMCPSVPGDMLPDAPSDIDNDSRCTPTSPTLTTKYVSSLASYQSLDINLKPIFQVISIKMDFEESSKSNKKNSIHFTHIRIIDGSGDVMIGRCAMNIAHEGVRLHMGDIIQLHLFTPTTYSPSKK
jgi:hypothetical protein